MSYAKTAVHKGVYNLELFGYKDGLVDWRESEPPSEKRKSGILCGCSYCGSMHPTEVVKALESGATISLADWKYGWPHKAYLSGVPNPHKGLREVLSSANFEPKGGGYDKVSSPRYNEMTGERVADHVEWVKYSTAPATTNGKFYTEHLQDCTEEERKTIEKALGYSFNFVDGKVTWERYSD